MNWKTTRAIASQEVRYSLKNKIFLGLLALVFFLFTVSAVVSTRAHLRSAQEMRQLQEVVAQQWLAQPDRHPHRVAHYGYLAFRPRARLAFFDFGASDFTGNSIFLEAHVQNSANFSEARQDSSLLRFGALTPAFVLSLLVPLLVIFLMGTSIGRERQAGTLAQVLSLGVRWRELMLGKALGGFIVFGMLLCPALAAVSLAAAQVTGSAGGEDLTRICLLGAFFSLYVAGWILVSLLVSAKSAHPGRATVILLAIWIITTTFLPKALPSLGAILYAAPSRPEFENRLHLEAVKGGHGHDPKAAQFEEKKQALLREHGVDSVEKLPVNWRGIAMQEGERASTEIYRRHYEELQETYLRQNSVSEWGSVLSPYLALRGLSAVLCGTDFRASVQFEREAEAYRYRLVQQLNELHIHEVKYENDKAQRLSAHHWEEFEPFRYQRPALGQDFEQGRTLIFILLAQLALLTVWLLNTRGQVR